jgi:hypothetical protein
MQERAASKVQKADRYEVAYRIWMWTLGYDEEEDRERTKNWLRNPEDSLLPDDIQERDSCLKIADQILGLMKEES